MSTSKPKSLPSREIGYNYCVAMFMAQQFEDGLRYLLDSSEYYGIIGEIELGCERRCETGVNAAD